jgi:hypothetical protein
MQEFWLRKQWPNDPKGYVFLARALLELGRARYGERWTGGEYTVVMPRVLEDFSFEMGDYAYATRLLQKHRPDVFPAKSDSNCLTPELWYIACDISRHQYEAVRPLLVRRLSVEQEFTRRAEAGDLATAYRPLLGGDMSAIPSCWWNTEGLERFQMCQLNPDDPYGPGFDDERNVWIFVSRESLDTCLSSQQFAPLPSGVQCHVSPYVRLMLSVAQQLDITTENQPKKDVVMEALRRGWPSSVPRSENLLEAMATLLREPGSQLGRAKK